MAVRPLLSQYPHLRALLRNDPVANAQFNAAISGLATPRRVGGSSEEQLEKSLAQAREKVTELTILLNKSKVAYEKSARCLRVLGEVIEAQLDLRPYSQDALEDRKYKIEFGPDQIRLALRLYWDALAYAMEDSLANTMLISDPAKDRLVKGDLDDE